MGGYGCADDGIGLVYMRARYYDPEIGRFISRDPWLGRVRDPLTLNRYLYVSNNHINNIDPEGLGWIKCFIYKWRILRNRDKCDKEYKDLVCKYGPAKGSVKFMSKYGAGWEGQAMWKCVAKKEPKLYEKWIKECVKAVYGPTPPYIPH